MIRIRTAKDAEVASILEIYNQGIKDRIATLETSEKDIEYMTDWFHNRSEKDTVLVAEDNGAIVGWASLNPYSHRCAYDGVADLSIYIARSYRGKGIGKALLSSIEKAAVQSGIHKIVLFTFPFNKLGQGLYDSMGYREVGVFKEQGKIDGRYVDVMAMEKILTGL
ncbi:arsinothricin resistance N-acetyltransferase ArsN1 [Bacillus swezeyi]|uniref:GNAT family N-acetyltransferase n=1 Tax=Bacillus swezeyi TaxID=1925020 RepID=A0A1R1RY33_9BACI|nr:arsinothricin resistance N-acetyltransferase ArsN1 family A [Bacillus swezeyi]MEC1262082.1 arsinothricin resistance N-acetyltransferase ArsN1 [Bacillus swezeyi]MED2928506.1 arsinothricin resistance N-acetyltransferase ArsN1 [Bacillus swezeyi]MED2964133.1 arsinothricin resistance N-acetyltransferase ArsN1 [Bacillus swezeyi]MED3073994.1 arsinothricin resistance N-acetyltransferase ArsN1 [Bacillus swezeyi]MED3083747.1 arsinothricin resistance N-acetyltransferase ArsN1 [Bacillus swezeyi]